VSVCDPSVCSARHGHFGMFPRSLAPPWPPPAIAVRRQTISLGGGPERGRYPFGRVSAAPNFTLAPPVRVRVLPPSIR
jgi:hypothetical protein